MMTDKKNQVTDAGAVALEESQLDDAQGGIIAVAPASNIAIKFDGGAKSLEDQAAQKVKGTVYVKL